MKILPKSTIQIEKIREAGHLATRVLDMITPFIVPGVSTLELNDRCHNYMVNELEVTPAPLNYHGFPKSICTSVNQVICHGIPNSEEILREGDIINLDITVIKDGFFADMSRMFAVGKIAPHAKRLIEMTREALFRGIDAVKPHARLGDIGYAIQSFAEAAGYSVVREYCGHGTGLEFHEPPEILHYGNPHQGLMLQPGMVFTIEPMINEGAAAIKLLDNHWTVETLDGKLSAQWEHTVVVTTNGCEILTV